MIGLLLTPYQKIYIMTSPLKPGKFKVGISTRPNLRARQVSKASKRNKNTKPVFSCGIFFAYPVEQMLHLILKPVHSPEKGDGGTEWFSVLGLAVISALLVVGFMWQNGSELAIWAGLAILFLSRAFCIVFISMLILLIRVLQELFLPAVVLGWVYFS